MQEVAQAFERQGLDATNGLVTQPARECLGQLYQLHTPTILKRIRQLFFIDVYITIYAKMAYLVDCMLHREGSCWVSK